MNTTWIVLDIENGKEDKIVGVYNTLDTAKKMIENTFNRDFYEVQFLWSVIDNVHQVEVYYKWSMAHSQPSFHVVYHVRPATMDTYLLEF